MVDSKIGPKLGYLITWLKAKTLIGKYKMTTSNGSMRQYTT